MDAKVTFLFEFNDHQSSVNVVRFSPCGRLIASASDRLIIVYEGILLFLSSPAFILML